MTKLNTEDLTFAEFVQYWKERGYKVCVTQSFLNDLDQIDKITFWDFVSFPFDLLEDLCHRLPQCRFSRWLSGWMATLTIMANRPLYCNIMRTRREKQKTYRIA